MKHPMSAKSEFHITPPGSDGSKRVLIKKLFPYVTGNQYPVKASVGEPVHFNAILVSDGHDKLFARVLLRREGDKAWQELEMTEDVNDLWKAVYVPDQAGCMEYKVQAWVSNIRSWKDGYEKKEAAGVLSPLDRLTGADLVSHVLPHLPKSSHRTAKAMLEANGEGITPQDIPADLYALLLRGIDKDKVTVSETVHIDVERERARFSTWYELFPRSCAPEPGLHGTFFDVIQRLPYLQDAGFDVLYLPPVHPIGSVNRKGKNNSLVAMPGDPGSPWAIGSYEGGHKALHPELGSMQDFKKLVKEAQKHGMEIAMDIAFQCAPDHPYVKDHPEWFKWRADGTVQFAENPPKKYEDILPFDFDTKAWKSLWEELLSIFLFWIDKGVRIFRVDNPHTKSLRLWQWLIAEVRKNYPDVIFLAEAFTRPNIMEQLAMGGFTQSYTYFTWRNTKKELQQYLTELTTGEMPAFFRPNFWPNTPDILPEHLVTGGEPMHVIRLLLAATLSSSYGIYGPVYERCIHEPMPGKEEYNDNEKYEIKYWPEVPESRIWKVIRKINSIRRSFFALQQTYNIHFLETSNDQVMAFLKMDERFGQHMLIVISLDAYHPQSAWVNLPAEKWGRTLGLAWQLTDHLNDEQYNWTQEWNYVALDPAHKPAHVFTIVNSGV